MSRTAHSFLATAFVTTVALIGCGGSEASVDFAARYAVSIQRLHLVGVGMSLYTSDYDDVLPPTDRWMDGLSPYMSDESAFVSPEFDGRATNYGYAFNLAVVEKSVNMLDSPASVVTVFDSTVLTRNATADLSTMPVPPRYGDRNTILYLDGHVQDEPLGDLGTLSVNRVKSLTIGMLIYASDYDDVVPPAGKWIDATLPYVRDEAKYHSPALMDPSDFGYALNIDVAGISLSSLDSPASTIGLFDSTNLARNATSPTTTLPIPARYPRGNTISFADGHVQ